jgi:hypothetical protein
VKNPDTQVWQKQGTLSIFHEPTASEHVLKRKLNLPGIEGLIRQRERRPQKIEQLRVSLQIPDV